MLTSNSFIDIPAMSPKASSPAQRRRRTLFIPRQLWPTTCPRPLEPFVVQTQNIRCFAVTGRCQENIFSGTLKSFRPEVVARLVAWVRLAGGAQCWRGTRDLSCAVHIETHWSVDYAETTGGTVRMDIGGNIGWDAQRAPGSLLIRAFRSIQAAGHAQLTTNAVVAE